MDILGSVLLASLLQLGSTPLWVPLVIILIIILIFWWGLTRNRVQDESHAEDEHHAAEPDHSAVAEEIVEEETEEIPESVEAVHAEAESESAAEVEPDDLKLIEGIGPKIAAILADAGIVTFAQLADSDTVQLEKIVREDAGITLADPSSWPDQAQLAADGNWDELEKLQDELHAGRKI